MNMRSPYVSAGFSDLTWQELWPRRDKQINRLVADLQQRNIIIVLVQNNNLKKKHLNTVLTLMFALDFMLRMRAPPPFCQKYKCKNFCQDDAKCISVSLKIK